MMSRMPTCWALVLLIEVGRAQSDCSLARPQLEQGLDDEEYDAYGGFGENCENLRCDENVLWMRQRGETLDIERSDATKRRRKYERNYCLVLAPDRYFAAGRLELRERDERFIYREKEYAHGSISGTTSEYSGCLDFCGMQCSDFPSNPLLFERLRPMLNSSQVVDACWDDHGKGNEEWITPGFIVFVILCGLLFVLIPCYLACAVSQKCCPGYRQLNLIRNDFDDRCPGLAKCLTRVSLFCRCPFSKCCSTRSSSEREAAAAEVEDEVTTQQPQGSDVEMQQVRNKVAPEPSARPAAAEDQQRVLATANGREQFRLLIWQQLTMKKRDVSGVAKQAVYPGLFFVALWMLYIIMGLTGFGNRWNKQNFNFDRKDGDTRDYERGQILSYGLLESFSAQLAFVSIMQYIIVGIVVEHHAKLLESTRMAGLKDAAYWASHFFVDGIIMGFVASLVIAIVAAPGLFRFAGFSVFPFGMIFALHWVYIVALVSFCFAFAVVIPSALIASLFSVIVQIFVVTAFWLLAPNSDGKLGAVNRLDPKVQRLWALIPQFAYSLIVDGFLTNRERVCRITASTATANFISQKYNCDYDDDEYEFYTDDAPSSQRDALEEFLVLNGATCGVDGVLCGVTGPDSEFPKFYDSDTATMRDSYVASMFGMLLLDILLYLVLAWYLNQVVPWSEYGTPKPWYFPLTPSFWAECCCGSKSKADDWQVAFEEDDEGRLEAVVEPRAETEDVVVTVTRLYKTFGKFRAVDGISFTMARSEIYCLLGHNGAGKTTTIACLTGLLTPDANPKTTAHIFGHDIFSPDGMRHLRATLGVCPQHDILFPKLTLKEHVVFFSRLKGKSIKAASRDADNLLEVFHLNQRAAHLGSELSGGQKRKLSTSIALAGNSKFVVLDEPTAGMDPIARRELWTLLRTVRIGRSLLLTSHHMDECEVLGDRVAVMVAGRIAASGTIPYLKHRYSPYVIGLGNVEGTAYRVTVHLGPQGDPRDIDDLIVSPGFAVRAPKEDAILYRRNSSDVAEEVMAPDLALKYNVALTSDDDLRRLSGILRTLDGTSSEAVARYDVATTTLEDVFLIVGKSAEIHNVAKNDHGDDKIDILTRANSGRDVEAAPTTIIAEDDLEDMAAAKRTTEAVVKQTMAMFMLRTQQSKWSVRAYAIALTPALVTCITAALAKEGKLDKSEHWSDLTNITMALSIVGSFVLLPGLLAMPLVGERGLRLRNLLSISGLDSRAFWLGTFLSDVGLVLCAVIGTLLALTASGMAYRDDDDRTTYDWDAINGEPFWQNVTDSELYDACSGNTGCMLGYLCDNFDDVYCPEDDSVVYHRRRWVTREPWLWALFPILALSIVAFSHFFSYGFGEPMMCVGAFPIINILGFLVGPLIVVICFALIFGGVMNGTDAIQLVSWTFAEIISAFGWVAATLSPIGNAFAFLLRATNLGFLLRNQQNQDADPTWPSYWASFVLLWIQVVLFEALAYLKDRIDTRPLRYVKTRFSRTREDRLDVDVREERNRVLAMLDNNVAADNEEAVDDPLLDEATKPNVCVRLVKPILKFLDDAKVALMYELPPDEQPPSLKRDITMPGLAAIELRKIYPPKRYGATAVEAVQGVTFAVAPGECFGLLGSNGAGKTTTMSMITRVVEPTSGDGKIYGVSTLTNFNQASMNLSVVNQMNTLWDGLSCYDHVALFAKLRTAGGRNVDDDGDLRKKSSAIEELVNATLAAVELDHYAGRLAGRLSGGMKRKLAAACALVADPRTILLDEPSAGLDPVSQRNLWHLIQRTMLGRSVILTTHSMLEADVLCDRIGIMTYGQLRCLGTNTHLKAKYTSGYDLVVKLDESRLAFRDDADDDTLPTFEDAKAKVDSFIAGVFADHDQHPRLVATDAGTLTYELGGGGGPDATRGLLARAFAAFDEQKRYDLAIAEFTIHPASLEKVFLNIVAESDHAHEEQLKSARLGRKVANELGLFDDDDDDLMNVEFREPTCCGCSSFSHRIFCRWNCAVCCGCGVYVIIGLILEVVPWFFPALHVGVLALFMCIGNLVGINMCLRRDDSAS